ncbi:MAG: division/cell wall cluster transcriptional repressor MraZ [Candidatus Rokuibacteriota bacterium]|nr:MAG: division/cell wall cluster transcriptional repressor MraZ [Candidatus Rokubacteria bacterium]
MRPGSARSRPGSRRRWGTTGPRARPLDALATAPPLDPSRGGKEAHPTPPVVLARRSESPLKIYGFSLTRFLSLCNAHPSSGAKWDEVVGPRERLMFRGRYLHTIDPKGRLSIPAKFRDALKDGYDDRLVVVPNESCLEVHPLEEWQRIEQKLGEKSLFDPDVRKLGRLYISRAKDTALDRAGRILIPPDVREQAGLAKEVTLVGGGRRHFEVWDRTRFDEFERINQDELSSVFDKLSSLGV